jgi:excisionase family DNA binding protein
MTMTKKMFSRVQIMHARALLDMLYTPAEIAEELGVSRDTVYQFYMPNGMPCTRGPRGHIWIHGRTFAEWVEAMRKRKPGVKLADGEAYCVKCKCAVKITRPREVARGRFHLLAGTCPQCKSKVQRGVK